MTANDKEIRQKLHRDLSNEYRHDPGTMIVHELKLCQGEGRIDIALVNGAMHGYEIKSARDTLARLPKQIEIYNRVFDTITVVVTEGHLKEVSTLVPDWWGIKVATGYRENVIIKEIRQPKINSSIDAFSLAQFLWRDELIEFLSSHNAPKEILKLPRFKLWLYVAENIPTNIPLQELKTHVRNCLRKRQNWRSDALRM